MFLDRLLNQGSAPVLERLLQFTETRQRLIADNIANVDTLGYKQKDLAVDKFFKLLGDRLQQREHDPSGAVGFDDIREELDHPTQGILFHDGNNRSMEQLQSEQLKNGMLHNMVVELLRKQYESMQMALRERVT